MTRPKILARVPTSDRSEVHIHDLGDHVTLSHYEPQRDLYGAPIRIPKGAGVMEALAFSLLGVSLEVPIIDATDQLP